MNKLKDLSIADAFIQAFQTSKTDKRMQLTFP